MESNQFKQIALDYLRAGLSVVPANLEAKKPALKEWTSRQKERISEKEISSHFGNSGGIGLIAGKVSGDTEIIDFDYIKEHKIIRFPEWREMVEAEAPGLFEKLVVETTPGEGIHVGYRCYEVEVPGNAKLAQRKIGEENGKDKVKATIETRGEGGFCIIAPSRNYKLLQGDWTDLPVITKQEREILIKAARSLNEYIEPHKVVNGAKPAPRNKGNGLSPGDDYNERGDVRALLAKHGWQFDKSNGTYEYWRRPGKDRDHSASIIDGRTFYNFSSNADPFDIDTGYSKFAVYALLEHEGDYSAAAKALVQQGYGDRAYVTDRADEHPYLRVINGEPDAPKIYHLTDMGNAERLADIHGKDLRYCYMWRKWLIWDRTRWKPDDSGEIRARAKDSVRRMYAEASGIPSESERKALVQHAMRCESKHRIRAMISLAQSESGIPVTPEELDQNPWLFNCQNGTIDLKTGILREHSREDLITKISPVTYDPEAKCPEWEKQLNFIQKGNEANITFIQRHMGCCMTGDNSVRVIPIWWGLGRNGKTTSVEVCGEVLGNYAMVTPVETLLLKRHSGIPNDIARLKGARFVYASEPEQGRRLAEALVKSFTGNNTIVARFMRGEYFEFKREFKIILDTNHRPKIKGTDKGIWDRIKVLEFTKIIPEDEQIPKEQLMEKFRAEYSGILNWMIKGCMDWQQHGLPEPEDVKRATKSYRDEMNVLKTFIQEICVVRDDESLSKEERSKVTVKELYEKYKDWCEENGEKRQTKTEFKAAMLERGLEEPKRYGMGGKYHWFGIRLFDPEIDSEK